MRPVRCFIGFVLSITSVTGLASSIEQPAKKPSEGRASLAEIRQAEAVLRNTSFGTEGAHFFDVRQVELLQLATRTEPLVGFCARATTDPYSLGFDFLAWRATRLSSVHVLRKDDARHRAIYDQYCSRRSGKPIPVTNMEVRQLGRDIEAWPLSTWLLLLISMVSGLLLGVLITRFYSNEMVGRQDDRRRGQRPAIHLRAEDYA